MDKIGKFCNEVFCRRDSNQEKAAKLWQEVKEFVTLKQANEFYIDWI